MPLINFGSILGFALEIENQNNAFISAAAGAPSCSDCKDLFKKLTKNSDKRVKDLQRTRRENVTEMILESIDGFTREPFMYESKDAREMDREEALQTAGAMFERSVRYYEAASKKLKGQSEVSRSLKTLAKKTKRDLAQLQAS